MPHCHPICVYCGCALIFFYNLGCGREVYVSFIVSQMLWRSYDCLSESYQRKLKVGLGLSGWVL